LTNRIRERDAFERLRRDGTRIHSTSLWCNFLSDPVTAPSRAAFAIGRAYGSAVARNRLRRRLRELLAARQRSDPLPPGYLLIGVRPGAAELTFDQLRTELGSLLDRIAKSVETRP
jgi:ribonuclease P protein component